MNAIAVYVSRFVELTPDELTQFTEAFREVRIVKRQFLVQPGFIARSRYFVLKGALRGYVVGDEGQDHTIQFETFFRMLAERSTAYMQRRIISNLTESAPERYDRFLEKYPHVVQRLPQYALASYLGMTTEFLSKIRNRKVKRK
ncbi:Crp/Fnr family transcriptional regulator [Dinghuibacter silviterrae]|uniref:CRP-like cAMP-binding protein n=1 Tax=Dinghuibacter silviterrae TaxID=1539049 RepID=A0A4R8DSP3_9BACT|nr:Crp/Fnr family transcriptional regulator [Dinghuibacter silviterrae]TDX00888.1 hypothetical protein EDB95_1917 [Dinghuibacter silviterrae]